jgi:hypothetical protein
MLTIKKVNDELRAITSQYIELVKGQGYYYFVYDDGRRYSTASVYVNSLNQLSLDTWLYEARCFYATIQAIK